MDADREEGRRERKKRLTRQAIGDTAMRLFTEHGFDAVTVTEIAQTADVSEKTVYNHFPSKTDLFFDEGDALLTELLYAVRTRAPGQSALDAVRGFVAGMAEWAAHRRPVRPTRQFRQLIAQSPVLRAAQRQMFARYETGLADLLAAETGAAPGAVEPFLAAVALVAVLRVPFDTTAGGPDVSPRATIAALHLLRTGLGGYAIASDGPSTAPDC